jgi:hypothetical protein
MMSTPVHQQSLQRKLLYIGLMVVLFLGSYLWRTSVVEGMATQLHLRDEDSGEVELTGKAVNLVMTGSRGLAVCVLWNTAMDKQKKNQFNELEMIIRSATRLQPHFVKCWIHHTWNLSYNVSVECHDLRDLYFYVSRGVDLLGEGERQNLHNPEMREHIGLFYKHKICQHDKTTTLRSLMQLSMIDPVKRDPSRFVSRDSDGRQHIKMAEFEEFCRENPQLIRRLNEGLRSKFSAERLQFKCKTPLEVVEFLKDNRNVPSLYEDPKETGFELAQQSKLKPAEKRFPLLPPARKPPEPQHLFDKYGDELTDQSALTDDVDAYALARSWFGYAQEPIPDPDVLPGNAKPIESKDRYVLRLPPFTTIIFRDLPDLAQVECGKRLEEEGWFDEGWDAKPLFGRSLVLGGGRRWAEDAFRRGEQMWLDFGKANGLYLEPEEDANKRAMAEVFCKAHNIAGYEIPPPLKPEYQNDARMRECRAAQEFLYWQGFYRQSTNFAHHYYVTKVEATPKAVQARKNFFQAEQHRLSAQPHQAIQKYDQAFKLWKELYKTPENREFRNDNDTQEDTADTQLKYLQLVHELRGQLYKQLFLLGGYMGQAATTPSGNADWLLLAQYGRANTLEMPLLQGPFDDEYEGKPLISFHIQAQIEAKRPGAAAKNTAARMAAAKREIPPGSVVAPSGAIAVPPKALSPSEMEIRDVPKKRP